jgi:hypothetical protein
VDLPQQRSFFDMLKAYVGQFFAAKWLMNMKHLALSWLVLLIIIIMWGITCFDFEFVVAFSIAMFGFAMNIIKSTSKWF